MREACALETANWDVERNDRGAKYGHSGQDKMPIKQKYFEIRDVSPLARRSWIPLRQATDIRLAPPNGILSLTEFVGIATAAIFEAKRADVDRLDWSHLGLQPHRSVVEQWGYHSADIFNGWGKEPLGINLVIDQHLEDPSRYVWHVHPDLVVALRLLHEGDNWLRPEEGWVEVLRMKRDGEGSPNLLEIRVEFLTDYLAARGMALYASSYHERVSVAAHKPSYTWPDDSFREEENRDRREARFLNAEYPDPSGSFRTQGALWRTEWIEAGKASVRVRGDKDPHVATFALENDGTRASGNELATSLSWLYFEPALVSTLLRYRGSRLHWYTQETGGLSATGSTVHFGVNDLGLITAFAKDISDLPQWEQRLWSAHNVTPQGGVSSELFAAQMQVQPAATIAPEKRLADALDAVNAAFVALYNRVLLRDHQSVPKLLRRAHRFQAAEADGLLELSKEITRLFAERIDVDAILAQLTLPKEDRKMGSLKALERLIAHRRSDVEARNMMAPMFDIYDLRLAEAHLESSKVASAKERAGIDDAAPPAMQGRQLLQCFVDTLRLITAVFA